MHTIDTDEKWLTGTSLSFLFGSLVGPAGIFGSEGGAGAATPD